MANHFRNPCQENHMGKSNVHVNEMIPASETPRLKGISRVTGEGSTPEPSKTSHDDVGKPNLLRSLPTEGDRVKSFESAPAWKTRKSNLKVGTWNVRGMGQGKLDVVKAEMERTGINILGVSELKWKGEGHFTSGDHTVYYCGKNWVTGVAFVVGQELSKSVLGYNPINDRIILLRLRAIPVNITLIQVYCPTTAADEQEITTFYRQLESTVNAVSSKDLLLILGDFNAKVGDMVEDGVTGTHGLGTRNEAGDTLVQFCHERRLCITNTYYQLPKRRKYTWTSPDTKTRNQIDYILSQKRWRNAITSVKTLPGADCGSDHELLVANLKIRLKKQKTATLPPRYDLHNTPEAYAVEVKNKFQALELDGKEPEGMWQEIEGVIAKAAKSHLQKKPKKTKTPWLSQEAQEVASLRRTAKTQGDRERYNDLQAQFQRQARADKKAYLEMQCMEVEMYNAVGKTRDMFAKIRELTGSFTARRSVLHGEDGHTLTEGNAIKDRWKEYTRELYQRETTMVEDYTAPKFEHEPPILHSEIRQAMALLANNKSPGEDNVPIELIREAGNEGVDVLHKLMNTIWRTGVWPTKWKRSIYVPIYKKGNPNECCNYRTISLISHASKILLKIIQRRLEPIMESIIPEEQAGFRRARGTRDHISNIRRLMETAREFQQEVYLCFIDYSKAFDCVDHVTLWNVLGEMGVPLHLIDLMRNLYHQQEAAVRTEHGDSEWFGVGKGVRQGCILSPYLFNIYAEHIIRKANLDQCGCGVRVGGRNVDNLRYADDTTLVASSKSGLVEMIERVKAESAKLGLRLNTSKTKIMTTAGETDFKVEGQRLEVVQEFVFLGSLIKDDGSCEREVRRRIALGRKAMTGLRPIMKDRGVPVATKLNLVNAMVFPVVTYGSESWTVRKTEERRIEAFELWCWRRVLRISWTDRVTNKTIIETVRPQTRLLDRIRKNQLTYFGHAIRAGGLEAAIMLGKISGKRRRGRQRTRWIDGLLRSAGRPLGLLVDTARDRYAWRRLAHAVTIGRPPT